MSALEIVPIIVTLIEMVKRFIPNRTRTWANPLIALSLGLGISYFNGGADVLLTGLEAAAGAVGAYKLPKIVGAKLVKDSE